MSGEAWDVDVSREDGYWVAVVRGLRGGATESRRLADLDVEVRDLVSGLTDADPDGLVLEWHYDNALSPAARVRIDHWRLAAQALEVARRAYEVAQTEVVESLEAEDVSVRDAAALTGLSSARVQQLRQSVERKVRTYRMTGHSSAATHGAVAGVAAGKSGSVSKSAARKSGSVSKSAARKSGSVSKSTARNSSSVPKSTANKPTAARRG